MSIWGSLLGGTAGYALGGPLGALIGLAAGHAVDRVLRANKSPESEQEKRKIAFTIATVALAAKMAKADGAVCEREKAAFARIFHFDPAERANVERIFDFAARSTHGFEAYARQVASLFDKGAPALEELLDCLFHIASADHAITEEELEYLRAVATHLGLDEGVYRAIRQAHVGPDANDPYEVLGVSPQADLDEIKRVWREQARLHHPDVLTGQGMPAEFVALAEKRLAAINAAYETILERRKAA
ncbi:MAG: TerB family tellurite resistance protein [Alphaproteobacteria bacterium]|nr:TerB family tellurite resistance protein [Alphaproteobacteria bacterium]